MKIGIVTQPLLNNYGGILQNFALQEALRKLGHSPITIDFIPPRKSLLRHLCAMLRVLVYRCLGKRRILSKRVRLCRMPQFDSFVTARINKTPTIHEYEKCKEVKNVECIIVGSDQVWRPQYNKNIGNAFLNFCRYNDRLLRVAYAASFGVDVWEFSPKQTRECGRLAKLFHAISVREESGVELCKRYLNVDASWVLDPTLLLAKEDYLLVCKDVPVCLEKYLAVYVLDLNEEIVALYEKEASVRGLIVKKFQADSKSTLTVPEWLAMFRDASYVVTDSFHGTVFSIIFGKEFKCIYNRGRGAARFESLMNLYNSGKLKEMQEFSIDWLKKLWNHRW